MIHPASSTPENKTEILFVTSYPPRECGIATYSQDLIKSLNNKFSNSLSIKVCALESGSSNFKYPPEVKFKLDTSNAYEYEKMAMKINNDKNIKLVVIQHEFGFFHHQTQAFLEFLYEIVKPITIVFHTVLPQPNESLKLKIRSIAAVCESIIVMTHNSKNILINEYGLKETQIEVIPHGTHLVPHLSVDFLKLKYKLKGRQVLSTFGLLSSGKGIETTIEALPTIIKKCPKVVFLIIGKTHPEVLKSEGEKYRNRLEEKVKSYELQNHVIFVNSYLALPDLLEYLQMTDIYLFTANDPNQAVSGTFAYAMSCACPIISTPIPHALELLTSDTGIIFDFRNSQQLATNTIRLLEDEQLRKNMSTNALQKIVSTAWENSAVAHANLFERISTGKIALQYNLPDIKLSHQIKMTTDIGIIQFSKINQPDIQTGYTLDDNARALVSICMHYQQTGNENDIFYIAKYISFIKMCQQNGGNFFNYIDKNLKFTKQNTQVNLDDSNGRAIWALGFTTSLSDILPSEIINNVDEMIQNYLINVYSVHSTRAMAFTIKGLYYYQSHNKMVNNLIIIKTLANRLAQMYKHESCNNWEWYESYLTYANSVLPEAMLYAWLLLGEKEYKEIAQTSFNFLLSQTFNKNGIEVISNKNWLLKGHQPEKYGEQPIDVAYTIMTLQKFYETFADEDHFQKMRIAFNWFLGNNRLHQIVYNPCSGGCYDGLEETHVNLNQGAESTLSYLMARMTVEPYFNSKEKIKYQKQISQFSLTTCELNMN